MNWDRFRFPFLFEDGVDGESFDGSDYGDEFVAFRFARMVASVIVWFQSVYARFHPVQLALVEIKGALIPYLQEVHFCGRIVVVLAVGDASTRGGILDIPTLERFDIVHGISMSQLSVQNV